MSNQLTIKFAGSPDEVYGYPAITGPVTRIQPIVTLDTIIGIEVLVGRFTGGGSGNYDFFNNLDDVILRTV